MSTIVCYKKDYKGIIIANEQFNNDLQIVQSNIDSLKKNYEKLKEEESSITSKEKTEFLYQLVKAEYEYNNYRRAALQQLEKRKTAMETKIVEDINNFIEAYGKENNYELIFGATNQGSIVFGKKQKDLTNIILKKLNEKYDKEVSKVENEK